MLGIGPIVFNPANTRKSVSVLSLFTQTRVVDDVAANNILMVFLWALENYDARAFVQDTVLVTPTRECFPDRADNELDMVKASYARVLRYSGLTNWPFVLANPQAVAQSSPPQLGLNTSARSNTGLAIQPRTEQDVLLVSYSSAMLKKPMDLVASMSKAVAQHYLYQSNLVPPAGLESFNETSEILSAFMGFGVLVANSAYTFRGSCARCYDPNANRSASLSESEALYSLAVFGVLKELPNKEVTRTLKPHLRSAYKKAVKQVNRQEDVLNQCRALLAPHRVEPAR